MAPVYWRTIVKDTDTKNGNVREKVLVIEPEYEEYPDVVEGAADISVEHHFEVQRIVQKHVDNAVSKTINLPHNYGTEMLAALWLSYLPYLKGTTFYRWGSRENEPFSPVPIDQAESVIEATSSDMISRKQRTKEGVGADCANGACEVTYENNDHKNSGSVESDPVVADVLRPDMVMANGSVASHYLNHISSGN